MAQHIATAQGIAAHIAVTNGTPTTTTLDIAEVYGKRHDHILRIVRQRMAEAPEAWRLPNFGETVIERPNPSGGAPIQSPVIRLTKKGFHFVVGKFTGAKAVAHQIAFADEFERMEADLQNATLPHQASINPQALLLSGGSTLIASLPKDLDEAIDAKAWDMAREAHTLARQHLLRRIAFCSQVGSPPKLLTKAAHAAVAQTTLGNALAHTHATAVRQSVRAMQTIAQVHQTMLDQAKTELQALAPNFDKTAATWEMP